MMTIRSLLAAIVLVFLTAQAAVFARVDEVGTGEINPDFGNNGSVLLEFGGTDDGFVDVALQDTGRLVAAGYTNKLQGDQFVLVRLMPNGGLDTSFGPNGSNGVVLTPIGEISNTAEALALQADQKIVVVGDVQSENFTDMVIARYTKDGVLDSSFGDNGVRVTSFGANDSNAREVAIQPDGKLVMVGSAENGANDELALVRFLADGTLDASFGAAGKVRTPMGAGLGSISDLVIQPDGKIVVSARFSVDFGASRAFVLRYNSDGSLDTSFNGTGMHQLEIENGSDFANAIALTADQKIVVGGAARINGDSNFFVARFNTNGSLDTTFSQDGIAHFPTEEHSVGLDLLVQQSGEVLLGGCIHNNGGDLAFVRFKPTGELDETFGTNGLSRTQFPDATVCGYGMVLDEAMNLFVVGDHATTSNTQAFVAQFNAAIEAPTYQFFIPMMSR